MTVYWLNNINYRYDVENNSKNIIFGKKCSQKTPASFYFHDLNTVGATTAEKKIIVPLHIEIIIIIGFIPIYDLRCLLYIFS